RAVLSVGLRQPAHAGAIVDDRQAVGVEVIPDLGEPRGRLSRRLGLLCAVRTVHRAAPSVLGRPPWSDRPGIGSAPIKPEPASSRKEKNLAGAFALRGRRPQGPGRSLSPGRGSGQRRARAATAAASAGSAARRSAAARQPWRTVAGSRPPK